MFTLGLLLLTCSALAPGQKTATEEGLGRLTARQRFVFGSAMPIQNLKNNADEGRFVAAATANFNLVEPENDFKPPAIWSGPREYNFRDGDFMLGEPGKDGWVQKNRFKFRGHVLVYARDDGYTVPNWLRKQEANLSKEEATALLHDYILAVAGRYKGKIAMWDVVNEAIDDQPNSNPFNLRNSFWFRKLGPEFLVMAFKWARQADPKAQLYYNEYGLEAGGPKGKHTLELAKWLKEKGAPIDGIGMQYHIDAKTSITPGDGHYQYAEEIGKLGLRYMVTELDVAIPVKKMEFGEPKRGQVPENPADLEAQAKVYEAVTKMALSHRHCAGINVWGVCDRYSWIPMISRGRNGAALLLDGDYKPKPALDAIFNVFRAR